MVEIRYVRLMIKNFGIVLINICQKKNLTGKFMTKEDIFC